jgi:hypothetical protein
MTTPQAVTERYVSNLLHYGRNKEFDVLSITQHENIVNDELCGYYFKACVFTADRVTLEKAHAATVSQALRRALEKHGVTFR